jgi:uncharacterized glyoxalase superfamily protein PhnB
MTGFVPYFGYRDAATALDWLGNAFGFETTQDYRDDRGAVIHAEMTFGDGSMMLGTGEPPKSDTSRSGTYHRPPTASMS